MPKKRQMTPLMTHLVALAQAAGLADPVGRSAAMMNRRYNDGLRRLSPEQMVAHMRTFAQSTAEKWRLHWLAGGSFKTLDRTQEQESAKRRAYRIELMNAPWRKK